MARGTAALLAAVLALAGGACQRRRSGVESIRLAVPYELDTLDPHAQNSISNFAVLSNVYEGLVATDRGMAVQPALAEAWESPDLLTWVFHLRHNAVFHDGRPLRARDVVYSYKRLLHDPHLAMRAYLIGVSGVEALDEYTVRIRTGRPSRILLNKLCFVLVVPEGTGASLAMASNGTGPYRIVDWQPGERLQLRRHPRHWSPRGLETVEIALGRSPSEAARGLQQGRYQLIQTDAKAVESQMSGIARYEVFRTQNIYMKYLGFDLAREVTPYSPVTPNPFRRTLVRQAISLAVDRDRLVRELPSSAVAAAEPVPRFIFGFDPSLPVPRHDPAQARALLAQAGLPEGFDVVLHVRRLFAESATLVRGQLAEAGIRAELKVVADPEFFEMANRREMSFWLSRWGCPTGDASDLLDMYVHSTDGLRQLGMMNYGGYSNPEVDRAIENSAEIEHMDDRRTALQGIMRKLVEDVILVPLFIDQDVYVLDRAFSWQPRADSYIRAAEIAPRD